MNPVNASPILTSGGVRGNVQSGVPIKLFHDRT
jgi:hypothetical protein